jgi:hypothetical protein
MVRFNNASQKVRSVTAKIEWKMLWVERNRSALKKNLQLSSEELGETLRVATNTLLSRNLRNLSQFESADNIPTCEV